MSHEKNQNGGGLPLKTGWQTIQGKSMDLAMIASGLSGTQLKESLQLRALCHQVTSRQAAVIVVDL